MVPGRHTLPPNLPRVARQAATSSISSAIWSIIVVVATLEPAQGNVLRKGALGWRVAVQQAQRARA